MNNLKPARLCKQSIYLPRYSKTSKQHQKRATTQSSLNYSYTAESLIENSYNKTTKSTI